MMGHPFTICSFSTALPGTADKTKIAQFSLFFKEIAKNSVKKK